VIFDLHFPNLKSLIEDQNQSDLVAKSTLA